MPFQGTTFNIVSELFHIPFRHAMGVIGLFKMLIVVSFSVFVNSRQTYDALPGGSCYDYTCYYTRITLLKKNLSFFLDLLGVSPDREVDLYICLV